jgi:leucine-rich repeat-containing protein 49
LAELKVLNLAGNQIRKICNMQGLVSLEELNIRRNRIRSTTGLEAVPTLEKLFISNNELQNLTSLTKLESLEKLQTIQMEGNPVWSLPDYSNYVISALPHLKVLDQQEIAPDSRSNASKWKSSQNVRESIMPCSGGTVPPKNRALYVF